MANVAASPEAIKDLFITDNDQKAVDAGQSSVVLLVCVVE
jgi:hypothetical protein